MRVVVTGATGNVGTSVLESLAEDPNIEQVVGVARRAPDLQFVKTSFVPADIVSADLEGLFRGANAVVHLAWLLQPSRDKAKLRAVNIDGSRRVFDAVVKSGVPQLVVASSVGAYAPGPKDRRVEETWPATGIDSSLYSRQKAEVECMLDTLQRQHGSLKVVRLRPALIFKRIAGPEIKRLFLGSLIPQSLLRSRMAHFVPETPGLCFQAVHSLDVADAYRRVILQQARGAFNLAAEPVLDTERLVRVFGAKPVRLPRSVLRGAAALTYRLGLQPTEPGWVDLALKAPLMSTKRASRELGWLPQYSALDAIGELFEGIQHDIGAPTAPLTPESSH